MPYAYIFVILGAISLIFFLFFRDKRSSTIAISLKTLTSVFFIITALVAIATNCEKFQESPKIYVAILLVAGLLFGLIGDFTLDFKIYFKARDNQKDSDIMTYVGMGAFAIGHILYITSAILLYPNDLVYLAIASAIAIVVSFLIVVVGGKLLKLNYGKWLAPALIYCFLLVEFVALSLLILIKDRSTTNILRFVGSIAFFISDLILSTTYWSDEDKYKIAGPMNPESRTMIILNHSFYYVAQFILAISLLYII